MDVSYIDSHAHIYLDQFRGNIDNIIKSEIYKLILSNNYTLANILHSDLVFINNNFRD